MVAQEPEEAEDLVGVAGSVDHQFGGPEGCLLLEETVEDVGLSRKVPGAAMAWKPADWSERKFR